MNELKTLKDIEDGFSSVFKITYAKALRQEAIKWIKKYTLMNEIMTWDSKGIGSIEEEHLYDHPELKTDFIILREIICGYKYDIEGIINWSKHFFNISEEDLK